MDRRIEAAVETIHREIDRNLPVRELAHQVNLSPWYFIHLFKRQMSVTPKQYILEAKLARAEQLLDASFLSVKEVAAGVGFGDRSHFSREFKKFRGVSPSEIRERKKLAG